MTRAVLLVLAALAFVSAVRADAPAAPGKTLAGSLDEAGRAAYERARTQYAAAEFVGALASFGRAFELSHDPRLLWNMAACERKLGRAARAIALIDRYVATGAALLTDADRKEAAHWRATLEKNVATVTVKSTPPGVEVIVDDEAVGTTPFAAPVLVDAGAHRVRCARRGFRSVVRLEQVAAGAALEWTCDLERIKVRLVSERPGASP